MALAEYGYVYTTKDPSDEWAPNEYKILNKGSGKGTCARDSSQATVTYITEYQYLDKFVDTIMGKTVKNGSSLSRSASSADFNSTQGSRPEEHPVLSNFYASSLEFEPLGRPEQNGSAPTWPKVACTVVFRPLAYNVLADGAVASELERFVTLSTETQSEFLTKNGYFYWVGRQANGQLVPLDIRPGQQVPSTRLTYTWHQIPAALDSNGIPDKGKIPNYDTVQSLFGCINEYDFDGRPPGTVCLLGCTHKLVMPQTASENGYYWDISYHMMSRDYGLSDNPIFAGEHYGWNYAFDSVPPTVGTSKWRLYSSNGLTTGELMYEYADLNQLFQVTW